MTFWFLFQYIFYIDTCFFGRKRLIYQSVVYTWSEFTYPKFRKCGSRINSWYYSLLYTGYNWLYYICSLYIYIRILYELSWISVHTYTRLRLFFHFFYYHIYTYNKILVFVCFSCVRFFIVSFYFHTSTTKRSEVEIRVKSWST